MSTELAVPTTPPSTSTVNPMPRSNWFSPAEDGIVARMALEIYSRKLMGEFPEPLVEQTIKTAEQQRIIGIMKSQPVTTAGLLQVVVPEQSPWIREGMTSKEKNARMQDHLDTPTLDGVQDSVDNLVDIKEEYAGLLQSEAIRGYNRDETVIIHAALKALTKKRDAEKTLRDLQKERSLSRNDPKLSEVLQVAKREANLRTLAGSILTRDVIPTYAGERSRRKELKRQRKAIDSRPSPALNKVSHVLQA